MGVPTGVGPSDLGLWLESDYPQFEHVTRLFRDGAFFVPSDRLDFKANEIVAWADASVFDVFTGQGVPEGKKSLAIEVTLQPREKTLTDAEIEAVAAKIVAAVQKATGGELRG